MSVGAYGTMTSPTNMVSQYRAKSYMTKPNIFR